MRKLDVPSQVDRADAANSSVSRSPRAPALGNGRSCRARRPPVSQQCQGRPALHLSRPPRLCTELAAVCSRGKRNPRTDLNRTTPLPRVDGNTKSQPATLYDAAMARPLIPVETIYTRALELLDAEGIDALQARKLAADLKISTRTLYQQVGNREQLIRALVARHFSQLRLDFRAYKTFDSTALHWSQALHDTLRAHPYLTELMEIDDRKAVEDYVNELVKAALREGFPRRTAIECCRALVNVTINHTIVEVRAVREPEHSPGTAAEFKKIERNFPMTIRWILAGVRAELESKPQTAGKTHRR